MNNTTEQICLAFERGEVKRTANSFTDGKRLYLFDNLIAEHRQDGLYITNAGWMSRTTKERLNGLTGVEIRQAKKKWFLNGQEWDGSWIKVNNNSAPVVDENVAGLIWNYSKKWVKSDAWRGYEEPEYAVCGANDTGTWSDSPCRSDVAEAELLAAKEILKKAGIQTKKITCKTSNVFCIHHYLIVRPKDKQKAVELMDNYLQDTYTNLLYACK